MLKTCSKDAPICPQKQTVDPVASNSDTLVDSAMTGQWSSNSYRPGCTTFCYCQPHYFYLYQGWEPIYHHGPHELRIIAGGSQNKLILS